MVKPNYTHFQAVVRNGAGDVITTRVFDSFETAREYIVHFTINFLERDKRNLQEQGDTDGIGVYDRRLAILRSTKSSPMELYLSAIDTFARMNYLAGVRGMSEDEARYLDLDQDEK